MSAFKRLNKQDVFVTTYSAKKTWTIASSSFSDYGIVVNKAISGSGNYYLDENVENGFYPRLVSNTIRHHFFGNQYNTGSAQGDVTTYVEDGKLYYFPTESVNINTYTRYFDSSLITGSPSLTNVSSSILSIPTSMYGTHIEPGSFSFVIVGSVNLNLYVDEDYVSSSYFAGGDNYVSEDVLVDDGENRIYSAVDGRFAGYIFYKQGIIIIDDIGVNTYILNSTYNPDYTIQFKSNNLIYTHNVICKIKDYEFNHTLNRTALSGSYGDLASNIPTSSFSPYITSIGLYNDANELIAVAKSNKPIPKSKDIDMTFEIRIDH